MLLISQITSNAHSYDVSRAMVCSPNYESSDDVEFMCSDKVSVDMLDYIAWQ